MISYPANLPLPLISMGTLEGAGATVGNYDLGVALPFLVTTAAPVTFSVSWLLDRRQYEILNKFWLYDIERGARRFNIELFGASVKKELYLCTMLSAEFSAVRSNTSRFWSVSATLTARKMKTSTNGTEAIFNAGDNVIFSIPSITSASVSSAARLIALADSSEFSLPTIGESITVKRIEGISDIYEVIGFDGTYILFAGYYSTLATDTSDAKNYSVIFRKKPNEDGFSYTQGSAIPYDPSAFIAGDSLVIYRNEKFAKHSPLSEAHAASSWYWVFNKDPTSSARHDWLRPLWTGDRWITTPTEVRSTFIKESFDGVNWTLVSGASMVGLEWGFHGVQIGDKTILYGVVNGMGLNGFSVSENLVNWRAVDVTQPLNYTPSGNSEETDIAIRNVFEYGAFWYATISVTRADQLTQIGDAIIRSSDQGLTWSISGYSQVRVPNTSFHLARNMRLLCIVGNRIILRWAEGLRYSDDGTTWVDAPMPSVGGRLGTIASEAKLIEGSYYALFNYKLAGEGTSPIQSVDGMVWTAVEKYPLRDF